MNTATRIFVAGHRGMVGSAIIRRLRDSGHTHLITADRSAVDLCDPQAVRRLLQTEKPEVVIVAAAKVGGIHANSTYPAEFIRDNLAIALSLIHESHTAGVGRLLFLGSSCIYPRNAPQPMYEEHLLTGPLEPTNEAYAIAKIAGLKLCEFYRSQYGRCYHSAMPTNLYGPGDNYHPQNSHVIPGLIRRIHEAKVANQPSVEAWGTGRPRREFLHVDDLARATLHLIGLDNPPDLVNVGTGTDLSITELAAQIAQTIGYSGEIRFDPSKPDGTPRKLLDISRITATGWTPAIPLDQGLADTYRDFVTGLNRG